MDINKEKIIRLLKNKKTLLKIVTIDKELNIKDAINIMHNYNISQLPVVDEKKNIIGNIDVDLVLKNVENNIKDLKVKDIMSKPLKVLDINDSISQAYDYFINSESKAIIVMENNTPAGIITPIDILNLYFNPEDKVEIYYL